MAEIDAKRTIVTEDEVTGALLNAWERRFGTEPPAGVLPLLLALSDLETATWRSMFNYNLGNIVPVGGQTFHTLTDKEGNRLRFRSYDNLDHGADEFIRQLTRDSRIEWREGLMTGDPREFVRALKGLNGGAQYFEAPFDRYLSGFLNRWGKYKDLSPKDHAGQDSAPVSPSSLSLEDYTGGFEINVNTVGIPHLGIDSTNHMLVKIAQSMLNLLADPTLTLDGQYGPRTHQAVLEYQSEHGLVATGTIDALTWASLIHTMKE